MQVRGWILVAALAAASACAPVTLVADSPPSSPSPAPSGRIENVECASGMAGAAVLDYAGPSDEGERRTAEEDERLAREAMRQYVEEPWVEDGGTAFDDYPGLSAGDFVMTYLDVDGGTGRAQFASFDDGDPVILISANSYGDEWVIGGHQICVPEDAASPS